MRKVKKPFKTLTVRLHVDAHANLIRICKEKKISQSDAVDILLGINSFDYIQNKIDAAEYMDDKKMIDSIQTMIIKYKDTRKF